jgi:hypothetical protein
MNTLNAYSITAYKTMIIFSPTILYFCVGIFGFCIIYDAFFLDIHKETAFGKKLHSLTRFILYALFFIITWNFISLSFKSIPSNDPEWSGQSHYDSR